MGCDKKCYTLFEFGLKSIMKLVGYKMLDYNDNL